MIFEYYSNTELFAHLWVKPKQQNQERGMNGPASLLHSWYWVLLNRTMSPLVLDLESSLMCCYLGLVEGLPDQRGMLKHFHQNRWISNSHNMDGRCNLVWSNLNSIWISNWNWLWILFINFGENLGCAYNFMILR